MDGTNIATALGQKMKRFSVTVMRYVSKLYQTNESHEHYILWQNYGKATDSGMEWV